MRLFRKILITLTIVVLLPALYLTFGENRPSERMTWGISFSKRAAEGLGIDWKSAYLALLDDLHVNSLRLGSYWDETEPNPDEFDFSDLDFQVSEAAARGGKIIITLGRRQPRWPECHVPDWAKDLPEAEQNERMLKHVAEVVKRYRTQPAVIMWQVENEFFFAAFGLCRFAPNVDFFRQEIALARALDPSRPVMTTDSGELSLWFRTAGLGDVFGTTMYRRAYNPVWGVANWPQPPVYYSRLGRLVRLFTGFQRIIIAELQAEPWAKTTLQDDPTEVNYETLSPRQFSANLEFAQNSGIDEAYLWGAEWWYYMREKRNIPFFWDTARRLWISSD